MIYDICKNNYYLRIFVDTSSSIMALAPCGHGEDVNSPKQPETGLFVLIRIEGVARLIAGVWTRHRRNPCVNQSINQILKAPHEHKRSHTSQRNHTGSNNPATRSVAGLGG